MPSAQPASRYRRRILGIGAVATGALYVIGAPIFATRIERDLEERVPIELAELGYEGVTAEFSGQDGTLSCVAPLDDPEAARAAAFDVHGVRDIEVDRSCRVNSADASDAEETATTVEAVTEPTNPVATSVAAATDEPDDDDTETSETTAVALAPIADVVGANPDLAFLSVLLAGTELGDGPVTLFAPSNAAFDELPPDGVGRLQNDPELLQRVLQHHLVDGTITASELATGELTTLSGDVVVVGSGDGGVTIDGRALIDVDIVASNGVVHVIDGVLLPADVSLDPVAQAAAASVAFDGAAMTLTGVVASEVERAVLVDAAVAAVGPGAVTDELSVDPDTGLSGERAAVVGGLVAAMPANLASGEVGFDGEALFARGVAVDGGGSDAFVAASEAAGVVADVSLPPEATEDDAARLEAELNAFVADNPIRFEPTSASLTPDAVAIIDRLAADVQQFSGIAITIEGHTDSDGDPAVNQQLSEARANTVRDELIARGVAADQLTAVGFGSTQPVLVDGVEDKAASRRVEFRVETST